jgi:hypothetical protein
MEMRDQIVEMWTIQEGLLQQYRAMAITLLGLISAGILVAISQLADSWNAMDGALPKLFAGGGQFVMWAELVIYAMFLTLLGLGIFTSRRFRKLAEERGRYVTFFQNLLVAEEAGKLAGICDRSGLDYPLRIMHVFRNISAAPGYRPMSFETPLPAQVITAFRNEIMQLGGANENPDIRHHATRKFLSYWIYFVFDVFFGFAGLFAGLAIFHLF